MNDNIYQAPSSDIGNEEHEGPILASRLRRLGGAIIDSFLISLLNVPVMSQTGYLDALRDNITEGTAIPLSLTILSSVLSLLVWLVVQSYPLIKRQQTVGKMLLRMKIVGTDQEFVPLGKLIGLRYLAFSIIGLIPLIGGLIITLESLLIFREDQRTGHDLLAGTRVVMLKEKDQFYQDTTTEAM